MDGFTPERSLSRAYPSLLHPGHCPAVQLHPSTLMDGWQLANLKCQISILNWEEAGFSQENLHGRARRERARDNESTSRPRDQTDQRLLALTANCCNNVPPFIWKNKGRLLQCSGSWPSQTSGSPVVVTHKLKYGLEKVYGSNKFSCFVTEKGMKKMPELYCNFLIENIFTQ